MDRHENARPAGIQLERRALTNNLIDGPCGVIPY